MRNLHVAPVRILEEKEVVVTTQDKMDVLHALYPKLEVQKTNRKYVCAVCKTVTSLTGLFLHMREVHNGILCQYCLKLFKRVSLVEGMGRGGYFVPKSAS